MAQAITWKAAVYQQIRKLSQMPERHALAAENASFPFDIREKLVGVGSRPDYRAIFTIVDSEVHVLTVRSAAQVAVTPDDL